MFIIFFRHSFSFHWISIFIAATHSSFRILIVTAFCISSQSKLVQYICGIHERQKWCRRGGGILPWNRQNGVKLLCLLGCICLVNVHIRASLWLVFGASADTDIREWKIPISISKVNIFGSWWNVLTTVGWITITFCKDTQVLHRLNFSISRIKSILSVGVMHRVCVCVCVCLCLAP